MPGEQDKVIYLCYALSSTLVYVSIVYDIAQVNKLRWWYVTQLLLKLYFILQIGITTEDVDVIAHLSAIEMDCYPSPLNYRGFPRSSCISVNNIACHGIPDDRRIQNGDILSIDITVSSFWLIFFCV